jgi:ubiquinone/menaquinone biosynthesis C-methylase UbiE
MEKATSSRQIIDEYIRSQRNLYTRMLAGRQIRAVAAWAKGKVLDIGCGRGVVEAAYGNQAEITSCDIHNEALFGVKVTICRAEKLPFGDKSFDSAFLIGVLEHTDNPEQSFAEAARVARKFVVTIIPCGFIWRLARVINLPEHLYQHAIYRWRPVSKPAYRKVILPGMFWMYVYKADQV